MQSLLAIRDLTTEFVTTRGVVHAVDRVDLDIATGEVLGLVGESGCGKSVTALSIMYLIPQPPGRIAKGQLWFRGMNLLADSADEVRIREGRKGRTKLLWDDRLLKRHRARMRKIRGREISMIFQEPMSSLNPVLPVGYQVAEVLMYQGRREVCQNLLERKDLSSEDLGVFDKAVATPEAEERDRLIADFCIRTGTEANRVKAIIEVSGLSLDERKERVRRLMARRRTGSRWFLQFVEALDAAEEAHYQREWISRSRMTMGQPAANLFDPAKNRKAATLPPLVRITPKGDRLELYFKEKPTEDLRARVELFLRDAVTGPDGTMFQAVDVVVIGTGSIDFVYKEPVTAREVSEAVADLFDANKHPDAKGFPPLKRISPGATRIALEFGEKPTETLRAQIDAAIRSAAARPGGHVLQVVTEVVLSDESVDLLHEELESSDFRAETEFRTRSLTYRLLMAIPLLRGFLLKPIEAEARRHVLELFKLVRIPEPTKLYDEYPHELSGGMQQRVMIAMALACQPALMIADEPTTALDVTTQAQILELIKDLRTRMNSAILYITHDLAVIAEICDRVAVMYAGKMVEDAPVAELFAHPMHPYTQGLLESIVSMDSKKMDTGKALPTIPGTVPDLRNPPTGCRFHPRCKFAWERCRVEEPRLLPRTTNHKVACHLYDPQEAGRHGLAR